MLMRALLHFYTHTQTHNRALTYARPLCWASCEPSLASTIRSAARPLCFRWRCSRERERDTRVKLYTRRTFDLAARPIRSPHREPSRAEVRAVIHPRSEPSGEQKPRLASVVLARSTVAGPPSLEPLSRLSSGSFGLARTWQLAAIADDELPTPR